MKRSKIHKSPTHNQKPGALSLWRAPHMVWRASRPAALCYERNTWCDGRHTILLYFWLQKRNRGTLKPIVTLDHCNVKTLYTENHWKQLQKVTNINSSFWQTLREETLSSPSLLFVLFLFQPCKHTLQHYFYSFYFHLQLLFFLSSNSFKHLINFSHNSFYTGNYCVSFTGSNLTLDHSILFFRFYFPVRLKNSRTNPTGLWWSVQDCYKLFRFFNYCLNLYMLCFTVYLYYLPKTELFMHVDYLDLLSMSG
jgi:hypothetical protein